MNEMTENLLRALISSQERQADALKRIAKTLDAATQGPNYGFWTKEADRD